jgi:hypothetical protein
LTIPFISTARLEGVDSIKVCLLIHSALSGA